MNVSAQSQVGKPPRWKVQLLYYCNIESRKIWLNFTSINKFIQYFSNPSALDYNYLWIQ